MISLRLVATGIRSMRVVYNEAIKSRAGQAWAAIGCDAPICLYKRPACFEFLCLQVEQRSYFESCKGSSAPLFSEETEEINPKLGQNMEKYLLDLMPVSIW